MYMSSAGWGVLIGEIRRFRENNGDIKLANMGPDIYEVYQMLEFYHIISEYGSMEEALKSFNVTPAVDKSASRKTRKKAEKKPRASAPKKAAARPLPPPVEELPAEEPIQEYPVEIEPKNEPEPVISNNSAAIETLEEAEVINIEEIEELPELPSAKTADLEETTEVFPKEIPKEAYVDKESTEDFSEEEQTGAFTEKQPLESFSEKTGAEAYAEDEPVENTGIILDEEIDLNIDGILTSEGISKSISKIDPSGYIQFDPEKYNRIVNIKVMPIPDKIRDIVGKYPELATRQIQKMLTHPDYGSVKIGYFKLRSLLKALDLDTKEKRYRFYRSA
jgi:hypothetical protein